MDWDLIPCSSGAGLAHNYIKIFLLKHITFSPSEKKLSVIIRIFLFCRLILKQSEFFQFL